MTPLELVADMQGITVAEAAERLATWTPDRWQAEEDRLERQPVDPGLFARTAPAWNCIDHDGGMHLIGGDSCSWCGLTTAQIREARQ
jgi:hypothetical protein